MAISDYEVVIGLEVHVELATESKLFCSCSTKFGAGPNENTCPACVGLPGMPAVLNRRAVELGITAGLLTNSEITRTIAFEKKNYYYPDLPTGYQITQLFAPICRNGHVKIKTPDGNEREIQLKQIHIEEDAGKLVHDARARRSLIDLNRAGVPLIEIVSMPDFHNSDEVIAYLERLRALLSFAGVSDCRMQEGSMRCDVNISLRPWGQEELGVRTEMKNINSFRSIARVIEYEIGRHAEALDKKTGELRQETRRWDDGAGKSFSMRSKENATDYRYFQNPEIPPVDISDDWIETMRAALPESSQDMFARLTGELEIPEFEAGIITGNRNLAEIFNATCAVGAPVRELATWMVVELLSLRKSDDGSEATIQIGAEDFAALIGLVLDKKITRATGKKVLARMLEGGIDPVEFVKSEGLESQNDEGELRALIISVMSENPKPVGEFRGGNEKVFGFLVGQIMRKTAGKAEPGLVNSILREELQK